MLVGKLPGAKLVPHVDDGVYLNVSSVSALLAVTASVEEMVPVVKGSQCENFVWSQPREVMRAIDTG